jgi:hypothetical protein
VVKKLFVISLILVCFSLALFNAGARSVEQTEISFSLNAPSSSLSNLYFTYPNTDISLIHGTNAFRGTHGFQKVFEYLSNDTRNIIRFASFSSSDNSLPGYLYIHEYLSHIYPFHNFW